MFISNSIWNVSSVLDWTLRQSISVGIQYLQLNIRKISRAGVLVLFSVLSSVMEEKYTWVLALILGNFTSVLGRKYRPLFSQVFLVQHYEYDKATKTTSPL